MLTPACPAIAYRQQVLPRIITTISRKSYQGSYISVLGSRVWAQLLETEMKAETIRQRSFNSINSSIGLIQLGRSGSDDSLMEEQYCIKEMQELHAYLDMVKDMIRPGCSKEMLQVALNSLAFLFDILTSMSSTPRPLASL